jgi:putative N-acetylmannosamine-6-phosphate epimerase
MLADGRRAYTSAGQLADTSKCDVVLTTVSGYVKSQPEAPDIKSY